MSEPHLRRSITNPHIPNFIRPPRHPTLREVCNVPWRQSCKETRFKQTLSLLKYGGFLSKRGSVPRKQMRRSPWKHNAFFRGSAFFLCKEPIPIIKNYFFFAKVASLPNSLQTLHPTSPLKQKVSSPCSFQKRPSIFVASPNFCTIPHWRESDIDHHVNAACRCWSIFYHWMWPVPFCFVWALSCWFPEFPSNTW